MATLYTDRNQYQPQLWYETISIGISATTDADGVYISKMNVQQFNVNQCCCRVEQLYTIYTYITAAVARATVSHKLH